MDMSEIKVCTVAQRLPPDFGGGRLAALRLAKRLHDKGIKGFCIALSPINKDSWEINNDIDIIHIKLHYGKKPLIFSIECLVRIFLNFLTHRHKIGIVHCHGYNKFTSMAIIAGRLLGKKVVLTLTQQGQGYADSRRKRWIFYLVHMIIPKAPAVANECLYSGISSTKITEIPNAIYSDVFYPATTRVRQALRKKLKYPEDCKILLFVGGINPRKGVDLLIETFIKIARHNLKVVLSVVGPTYKYKNSFHEQLYKRIDENNLRERVFFTKRAVENVVDYMQASDVFVFPSRKETFGTVVGEAMACGLPVVAMNIPGVTDTLIDHGIDGFIVPQDDSKLLSEQLISLLHDENVCKSIGAQARKKVMKKFSLAQVDQAYLRVYRSLLSPTY